MKLLTFVHNGVEQTGILSKDEKGVVPLKTLAVDFPGMEALIKGADKPMLALLAREAEKHSSKALKLDCVELKSPIPRPSQDIICLGMNYADHAQESMRYKKETFDSAPQSAVYFGKRANPTVGHGGKINSHPGLVQRLDYEAELAVIIGKDAKNVPEERAADYIFGYSVLNDVSARVLQVDHKQWYFGKSLDTFAPLGPWIVTANEFAFPPDLVIQSRVNGQLRQNSRTSLLIHSIASIISELSRGITLWAGTIIATGTPAGVGMGFDPPQFLRPGDVVDCFIEGIGILSNEVV